MQCSYSFSRSTYNLTDLCYQEREIYSYVKDKLIYDEKDAVGVIYGPRGIGKSSNFSLSWITLILIFLFSFIIGDKLSYLNHKIIKNL